MIQIGLCQIAQSFGYDDVDDEQMYEEEIASAVLAEEAGFDIVSMVEHHFEDYAACPDNFVYLSHLAAKTSRIKLFDENRLKKEEKRLINQLLCEF